MIIYRSINIGLIQRNFSETFLHFWTTMWLKKVHGILYITPDVNKNIQQIHPNHCLSIFPGRFLRVTFLMNVAKNDWQYQKDKLTNRVSVLINAIIIRVPVERIHQSIWSTAPTIRIKIYWGKKYFEFSLSKKDDDEASKVDLFYSTSPNSKYISVS